MDYVEATYNGKTIYSGHPLDHQGKASMMASMLQKYGWCFPPIPVVDLGAYFQALDGTHRLWASQSISMRPEIVALDMRLHPDQPLPEGWKEIVNAPLAHGRIIRGFGLRPNIQEDHMGVVLDPGREILRVEYVDWLFRLLLRLTRKVQIIQKGPKNG